MVPAASNYVNGRSELHIDLSSVDLDLALSPHAS